MHVHACMIKRMRITIEIADDKWVRLKKMAAERGLRGYSSLIDTALEGYLDKALAERDAARRNNRQGASPQSVS